ncbi:MAG TPA: hypothetical protein VKZ18_13205 [Polyangia bacterium]|nr:hypothetical protein [Polyangia bacterium]
MKRLGTFVFALAVSVAVGTAGCGGGGSSGPVSHPLPGATQIDIAAGQCYIVNAVPQSLPPSTVSFTLVDAYGTDLYEVGVVPSSNTCYFDQTIAVIDDAVPGSGSDSAAVPAGTYDLDVICQNSVSDCLLDSITWEATY